MKETKKYERKTDEYEIGIKGYESETEKYESEINLRVRQKKYKRNMRGREKKYEIETEQTQDREREIKGERHEKDETRETNKKDEIEKSNQWVTRQNKQNRTSSAMEYFCFKNNTYLPPITTKGSKTKFTGSIVPCISPKVP